MNNKAAVDDTDSSSSENEGPSATSPPIAIAIAIPSAPPLETTNIDPQLVSDEEAQASVTAARAQGIATIRQHCEQHLHQNPDSSYVTWIATLHPENAQVSIDPRFMVTGNNPWRTVYEEAKEDLQKKGGRGRYVSDVLEVTPVSPSSAGHDDARDGREVGTDAGVTKDGGGGGCLDFLVGNALVLIVVALSFSIELAASYCYLSYWLCCKIVGKCSSQNKFTWLPLFVAFILAKVFQLLDIVLLFASIVFVESIAGANYILCTILACSHDQGKSMHQMTRKLPHLVRWAFRQTFEEWDPPLTQDLFKLQMRQAKRLWTADWAENSVRHGEQCLQSAQQHSESQAMATAAYFQAEKLASQGIKLARDQDCRAYEMAWRSEVRESLRDELTNQNNRFNIIMLCDTVCLSCVFSLVADGSPPTDTPQMMLYYYVFCLGLSVTLFTISLWCAVIVVRRLHEHTASTLERKLFAQSEDLQKVWRHQLKENLPTGPDVMHLVNQEYETWVAEYLSPIGNWRTSRRYGATS